VGGESTLTAGWYLANETIVYGQLSISGDIHLILADDCTLTENNGVLVSSSDSLTIYAQSDGASMGKLTAIGNYYNPNGSAGIGGDSGANSRAITINGGNITANGSGNGAGIGGGGSSYGDRCC
jgi:hypothetical protein